MNPCYQTVSLSLTLTWLCTNALELLWFLLTSDTLSECIIAKITKVGALQLEPEV